MLKPVRAYKLSGRKTFGDRLIRIKAKTDTERMTLTISSIHFLFTKARSFRGMDGNVMNLIANYLTLGFDTERERDGPQQDSNLRPSDSEKFG